MKKKNRDKIVKKQKFRKILILKRTKFQILFFFSFLYIFFIIIMITFVISDVELRHYNSNDKLREHCKNENIRKGLQICL